MFNKYDAYKDSCEGWIGLIPNHWEVVKLKHLFTEKKHKKNMSLSSGSISFGDVVYKDDEKITEATKASYQEVLKGEFLLNPLNLNYDLISLRIALSKINVVVSAGYIVLLANNLVYKEYFKYLLHRYDVAYMKLLGSGVRQTISFNHIANSLLPYPSMLEQKNIAEFLDQKTSEIDQAIAIKEQQIALLNERKQIVIQKAVTQGLNPNVPMKDSGVEWIGRIPEHWDLLKLKNLALVNPTNTTLVNSLDKKTSVCFLAMESVETNGTVDYSHTRELASVRSGFTSFVKGDVLVAKITPCFENGKGAYLDTLQTPIGFGSTEFHVLRVKKNCDPKFLYYVTKSHSFMDMGEGLMIGSAGQKRVPTSFMQNYLVAIPDIETQIEIVNFIDQRLGEIAEAIDLQKKQIEKLKEYKITLINDAVTGKIKVA